MSIIQTIRDKAAWIIIGAIALALIAFILQDGFVNRSMFGDNSTVLGKVNGTEINAIEFDEKVRRAEEMYRQQGYPMNDMMRNSIRESLWNEYLEDGIMNNVYENLGIQVSDNELNDILFGANPPQDLRQQFTDPNTGQYDPNAAYQQIQQLRKQRKNPQFAAQYASFFEQYLPALRKNRQKEKYMSMLAFSAYAPKWMAEKLHTDNSQKAAFSYVNIPYHTVSDSAVTVTDAAVKEYISAHPDQYKQEASRTIQYVMFDASPTSADSAAIKEQVETLKAEFAGTTDVQAFLIRNGSETQFTDAYEVKSRLRSEYTDSIISLSEGAVFGPYIERGSYVLAKLIGKRNLPDSVKVRHILIKTEDQGRPVLDDSTAKARIDSVVRAIRGGASFNEMVTKYTDDMGSKEKGGEYEFSLSQFPGISKEFAEVAFYGVAGDKKTVKVSNAAYGGYHYIEVINQRKFEPAYKIAEFAKAIVPSDETTTTQFGLASQFAAESRDKKAFDAKAAEGKLPVLVASDLKPLDAMIMGVGSSRELVRWAFEAKAGDVAEQPFQVEDKFLVPVLVRVYEEGLMPVDKARPLVEATLRNKEKAKQIVAKIKDAKTLEAVAEATGQQVNTIDSLLFNTSFIPNLGQEPKLVGAAFNKANQGKISGPIVGNGGVFVLQVNSVGTGETGIDVERQRENIQAMLQRAFFDPRVVTEVYKKTVTIKDNRHKFF